MLIWMKFWLMPSQFSMILSSPIFLSISAGSSVANIAAGFGKGMLAEDAPDVGGVNPGTGMPNGFHIRCMNSIASWGLNGSDGASDIALSSWIHRLQAPVFSAIMLRIFRA